jgi:hypothetical protein
MTRDGDDVADDDVLNEWSKVKVLWSLWVVVSVKRENEMNKRLLKVPFGVLFISSLEN